jgi:hypothetical protein
MSVIFFMLQSTPSQSRIKRCTRLAFLKAWRCATPMAMIGQSPQPSADTEQDNNGWRRGRRPKCSP